MGSRHAARFLLRLEHLRQVAGTEGIVPALGHLDVGWMTMPSTGAVMGVRERWAWAWRT